MAPCFFPACSVNGVPCHSLATSQFPPLGRAPFHERFDAHFCTCRTCARWPSGLHSTSPPPPGPVQRGGPILSISSSCFTVLSLSYVVRVKNLNLSLRLSTANSPLRASHSCTPGIPFGHFSSSTARTSPCRHAHHFTPCCKVFMSPRSHLPSLLIRYQSVSLRIELRSEKRLARLAICSQFQRLLDPSFVWTRPSQRLGLLLKCQNFMIFK